MTSIETLRILRGFYNRHHKIWQFVRENDESFWIDLSESVRETSEAQWVRRDLVLTEFPEIRDASQQTSVAQADEATQTKERRPVSVGVQTGNHQSVSVGTQTGDADSSVEAPVMEPRRPTVAEVFPVGCWNCHSEGHAYPRCPLPRRQSFCFGCGSQNVTLADCRRCGPRHRTTRPYTAPRSIVRRARFSRGHVCLLGEY